MITLQNHNEKIKSIDLTNAPEPIKKGKELFEKSAKFYDKSDAIKKTIDLYIAKLNEYAAKEDPYSDIDVEKINNGMPSKMMTDLVDKIENMKPTPNVKKDNERIIKMVESWKEEGRAFSKLNNDDANFFKTIKKEMGEVGVTSQTGNDLVYYNTDIYDNDTDALRKKRKAEPKVHVSPKNKDLDPDRNPEYDHLKMNQPNKLKKEKNWIDKKIKNSKKPKAEPTPKVAKTKTTKKATKKTPCKPKTVVKTKVVNVKPKKAPVTKQIKSLELQLLNRYNNMDGRNYQKGNLSKFAADIKKAFENDFIADHVTLIKEIRTSMLNAVEKMNEAGVNFVDVKLDSVTKAKVNAIIKAPQIKMRIEYLGDSSLGK